MRSLNRDEFKTLRPERFDIRIIDLIPIVMGSETQEYV